MDPALECLVALPIIWSLAATGADALETWTTTRLGINHALQSITFGNGQFVAVGDAGTILTSTDGTAWTARSSGTSSWLQGIAFGGGRFVAVGNDGRGITALTLGEANTVTFHSHYSDTNVCPAPTILTSTDAITWTPVSAGTTNPLVAVTYADGRFIAVGGGQPGKATVVSSPDGLKWSPWRWKPRDVNLDPSELTGVTYGNGRFVAVFPGIHVGGPLPCVFLSPEGVTWAQLLGPPDVRTVVFGNGVFVAGGSYWSGRIDHAYNPVGVLYSSVDGTNWTLRATVSRGSFSGVAYGGGQFVALTGLSMYRSSDGTNWVARSVQVGATAVTYANGQFIGVSDSRIVRSGIIGKPGAGPSRAGQTSLPWED